MSLAASLGTFGLALRGLNEDARKQQMQDEALAMQKEDRAVATEDRQYNRKFKDLQFGEIQAKASEDKVRRERLGQYNALTMDAKDDEDFLSRKLAKSKELGDGETFMATKQQMASMQVARLKSATERGMQRLMATGDATGLQDAYNSQFPDGNKVAVSPLPDGTYDVTFADASGKEVARQPKMTRDQIGMMAMQMIDPKFSQKVWMDKIDADQKLAFEDAKGNKQLERDKAKEADRAKREAENIALRGVEERRGIGARTAGELGLLRERRKFDNEASENNPKSNAALEKAAKEAGDIVLRSMKTNAMGGIDPNSSQTYLEAQRIAADQVRSGKAPQQAAEDAMREVSARNKAQRLSPSNQRPAGAGLYQFQ